MSNMYEHNKAEKYIYIYHQISSHLVFELKLIEKTYSFAVRFRTVKFLLDTIYHAIRRTLFVVKYTADK